MPSRVTARRSGVPFTSISLFCSEITTERRLGSLACGFSGSSGIPPVVVSTSEVQPAIRHSSSHERHKPNLANVFMFCYVFNWLLLLYILSSYFSIFNSQLSIYSSFSSPSPAPPPAPFGTILPPSACPLPGRPARPGRSTPAGHPPPCPGIGGHPPGRLP